MSELNKQEIDVLDTSPNNTSNDNTKKNSKLKEKALDLAASAVVTMEGASPWHYAQTFCCFFSLIGSMGALFTIAYGGSSISWCFSIMAIIGIICTLLTSVKEVFSFANKIATGISGFLAYISIFALIPFLPLLVLIIGYIAIYGMCIGATIFIPAIITIPVYFMKIFPKRSNVKAELIVIALALILTILLSGGVFLLHKTVATIEAPIIENSLNREALYNDFIERNPNQKVDNIDLNNPTKSNYNKDDKDQTDVYEFTSNENGMIFKNATTIYYSYLNSGWQLIYIETDKTFKSYELNLSGKYSGLGEYWGNLSSQNLFSLTINELTNEGGTGTFNIFLEETINETRNVTFKILNTSQDGDNVTVTLEGTFDTPLLYDTFISSGEKIPLIECTYSAKDDTFYSSTFDFGGVTLSKEN